MQLLTIKSFFWQFIRIWKKQALQKSKIQCIFRTLIISQCRLKKQMKEGVNLTAWWVISKQINSYQIMQVHCCVVSVYQHQNNLRHYVHVRHKIIKMFYMYIWYLYKNTIEVYNNVIFFTISIIFIINKIWGIIGYPIPYFFYQINALFKVLKSLPTSGVGSKLKVGG